MFNKTVELKFGKMRKAQEFILYLSENKIVIQSSKSIGELDVNTLKFRHTDEGAYFPHLLFAREKEISQEIKDMILEASKISKDKKQEYLIAKASIDDKIRNCKDGIVRI